MLPYGLCARALMTACDLRVASAVGARGGRLARTASSSNRARAALVPPLRTYVRNPPHSRFSCTPATATASASAIAGTMTAEEPKMQPPDELFIYETGEGDDAVIMLHGLVETHQYWLPLLKHLNQKNFKYICPDLLGHGRSPKPRHEGYNVDSHLRYILRDVFEGWTRRGEAYVKRVRGPVRIIGHGVGATLALEIASRCPERVAQIILIGLPYFPDKQSAWTAFAKPLDYVLFYNSWSCRLTVAAGRWLRPISPYIASLFCSKPPALLDSSMRSAAFLPLYLTYLYCIVYHRLDGAAENIRKLSKLPVQIIHPNASDACVPLSCARSFFANYADFTELTVFKHENDLVVNHPRETADHINRILFAQL